LLTFIDADKRDLADKPRTTGRTETGTVSMAGDGSITSPTWWERIGTLTVAGGRDVRFLTRVELLALHHIR
jgi:hypothetical protein